MSIFDGLDVSNLESSLGQLLASELSPIIGAAADDLKEFGLTVAKAGVQATLAGDKAWSDEIKAQVSGLLEVQRIRTEVVAWDAVEKAVGMVFRAVLATAGAIPKPI